MKGFKIRPSRSSDESSIEKLYLEAFPEENLLPLVRDLLREETSVFSLVGILDESIVGNVIFTTCSVDEIGDKIALLGPLAVANAWQRKGIGRAMVSAGFQQLKRSGLVRVCVLGDPAYYQRFGFVPETCVMPPYQLPEEWCGAWQSVSLRHIDQPIQGKLSLPEPWLRPALWAPSSKN